MALKTTPRETQRKSEIPREPNAHREVRKVRKKVKTVPRQKPFNPEKSKPNGDQSILKDVDRLFASEVEPDDLKLEPPHSEIPSSPERLLSIESDPKKPFPPSISKIIGNHDTFWKAMEDDSSYESFLKALPKFKKELDPCLLSEMLLVCAEQSYEVTSFVQDTFYTGKPFSSWKEATLNPTAFADFMKGYWITQIFKMVKPKEAVVELLSVAVVNSKPNAHVILDKAKRDAEGGPMTEIPPYTLKELLGAKAYDRLIFDCLQTVGMSDGG